MGCVPLPSKSDLFHLSSLLIPCSRKTADNYWERKPLLQIWLGLLHTSSKVHKNILKIIKNATPTPPKRNLTSSKKTTETKNTSPQGLVYQVRGVQVAIDVVEIALHRKDIRLREIHGDGCAWCTRESPHSPSSSLLFRPLTIFFWKNRIKGRFFNSDLMIIPGIRSKDEIGPYPSIGLKFKARSSMSIGDGSTAHMHGSDSVNKN